MILYMYISLGQVQTLYTSFHNLIKYIAMGQGQTTPGDKSLMSLRSFATSLKKKSLRSLILYIFFMILYMYISLGQVQTAPRVQNFDVNTNVLSLHSFVASFKKISLKSDFIHFFS